MLQSVDLAIRNLLRETEDPLALATYLWTLQQHKLLSINSDSLVAWGMSWIRRIVIDEKIGRRRDDEVASAALVIISLVETPALDNSKDEIREKFKRLLSAELDRSLVPFRRPSYAAILILAAHLLDIDEPRISDAITEVANAFIESIPGGRLYGLAINAQLILNSLSSDYLKKLEESITLALRDPGISYEDQIYLLQAIWRIKEDEIVNKGVLTITEQSLLKSPVWTYLMHGMEDIPSAGDGKAIINVSHLYRAALLDVVIRFEKQIALERDAVFHSRYRGKRSIGISAFGFYILLLTILWLSLGYLMLPRIKSAKSFWLHNDYNAMSTLSAFLFLLGLLSFTYLVVITPVIVFTLYSTLVRQSIASDKRIRELVWERAWKVSKAWAIVILIAVVINIFAAVILPGIQHLLNNK